MKLARRRLLIVDPDSRAAQEMSSLFTDEGYDVETSGCISEAAEMINNVKFDCVIMDVDLTEMKGYKAIPILKAIDPKIQIIMIATENTVELELEVRKQDVFYYYIKSFDREELKEAVRDVFKKLGKVKEVKKMDKDYLGFASIIVLAIILLGSILTGQDGTLRLSAVSIIGLIAGTIFGFKYATKGTDK